MATRIEPAAISAVLLEAPAWARVGLTVRDPRTRARAADQMARAVVELLDPPVDADRDQLALPL